VDPQATWDELLEAYAEADWDRVEELADALIRWLQRGGFPPRAVTGSDMGHDWDRAIALAGCRFATAQARKEVRHVPLETTMECDLRIRRSCFGGFRP